MTDYVCDACGRTAEEVEGLRDSCRREPGSCPFQEVDNLIQVYGSGPEPIERRARFEVAHG